MPLGRLRRSNASMAAFHRAELLEVLDAVLVELERFERLELEALEPPDRDAAGRPVGSFIGGAAD